MRTLKTILIALLLASDASAAPKAKAHYQYDVCYLANGRVNVVDVAKTVGAAMSMARLLDRTKADGGAKHTVIVEQIDVSGDVVE